MYSMSLSVGPEDVPLTLELLRAHRVSVEFDAGSGGSVAPGIGGDAGG